MPKSRLIKASPELKEMLDSIRKEFGLRNNVEATKVLTERYKKLKGSVLDLVPLMVIFLIFSVCSILGYYLLLQYQDVAGDYLNAEGEAIVDKGLTTVGYFDEAGFFIFICLCIGIIAGAYYLRVHPVLLGVTIVVMVFVIFVAAVLSDTFTQLVSAEELSEAVGHFSKTLLVWENMPVIILLIGTIIMIVIYSTSDKDSGGFT